MKTLTSLLFTCLFLGSVPVTAEPCRPTYSRFYLTGMIGDEAAEALKDFLSTAKNPEIVINSNGGFMDASIEIASTLAKRHDVRCVVKGNAKSGAFAALQSCKVRLMTKGSVLGTHEPRFQAVGGSLERVETALLLMRLEASTKLWNALCGWRLKITAAEYEAKVKGHDWTLDSAEALKVGAVDGVMP